MILKVNKINILDVRKKSEYNIKHIEGAVNAPLGLLNKFKELENL